LKLILRISIVSILWPTFFAPICLAQDEMSIFASTSDELIQVAVANIPPEPSKPEAAIEPMADPIEPVNRAFFYFNDKLYFWVLKPVATGYKTVLPEDARVGVRNFFSNLTTPIRVANCLLQIDFKCAGTETLRFLLNTGLGMGGFLDPGRDAHLEKQDRDFGQTLGIWGIGPGIYLVWPILGPSSARDTVGSIGDFFLDPRTYLLNEPIFYLLRPVDLVNDTSLKIGEYEDFKEAAIDPYIALKDAYTQYRQKKIQER
jgi:phospholipid-binding lipoprotein MlaA